MHKSKTSSSKAKYPEQMAVPPETTGSKKQNSLQKNPRAAPCFPCLLMSMTA